MKSVYYSGLLGSTPMAGKERERKEAGWQEKLGCDAVSVKPQLIPWGGSGGDTEAGMAFQSNPVLGVRPQTSVSVWLLAPRKGG